MGSVDVAEAEDCDFCSRALLLAGDYRGRWAAGIFGGFAHVDADAGLGVEVCCGACCEREDKDELG